MQDLTAELADQLRDGLNATMDDRGVRGLAYGRRSCFRIIVGDDDELPDTHEPTRFLAEVGIDRLLEGTRQPLKSALHKAFFLEGFDFIGGNHGWLSAAHTPDDVSAAVAAFGRALDRAMEDRLIGG